MKILILILSIIFITACSERYNNKYVKDIEGNLYQLKSVGYNDSYRVIEIPQSEIDSLLKQ